MSKPQRSALTKLLLIAAETGITEAVLIALDNGADVNAADRFGITALHKAVHCNNYETVKLLLERGANPDQPNITGQTPRQWSETDANSKLKELFQ